MMKKFTFDIKWILIAGIIGFLLVFQVFPLVYLLFRAFFATGHFSLESFARIYSYALNWTCLKNTLFTALLSMVFGVLIAFPLAWLVGRTNLHGRRVFRTLFVMTYMVPPYVGAMAWLRLLNPSVGTLNVFLQKIFGLAGMPFNIYTTGGLVWVLTTFYYPYAFITISRAMEKMDPSLEEASRISGASPLKTLFTVTIPLMLPSIAAAGLLVFVAAASCYGIPSIIGAPGKIYTVTTRIVDYVYVGSQQGLTDATVLAVFLMLLAMVILYVSNFVIGKKDYITVSGKSVRPAVVDLGRWNLPITILVGAFAFIVVILPFATVFMTSFTVNMGKSLFAAGNMTTKYWGIIFSRKSIIKSFRNSVFSALWAANTQCRHRSRAHHDHVGTLWHQYLQYDGDPGRRLHDQIYAHGNADRGLCHLADQPLPGGGCPDLRSRLAQANERCGPAPHSTLCCRRLVFDLHALLL